MMRAQECYVWSIPNETNFCLVVLQFWLAHPSQVVTDFSVFSCRTLHVYFTQFTRDALIELSGAKEKGRNFVYFTDVKRIPSTDLATIERLWNKFSGGKFGYSVQKVRCLAYCLLCCVIV